ncbi:MAG: ABC transporter ATP-binding protein [Alkaliphilus sp.]
MNNIRSILKVFEPFKKDQYFTLILTFIMAVLTAVVTFKVKTLIDTIMGKGELSVIYTTSVLILGITVIIVCIDVYQNYFWHNLRHRGMNFMRAKMYKAALYKPITFFKENSTGDVIAKVMDDASTLGQNAVISMPMLWANIIRLTVVLIVLFMLNISLAMLVVLSIPIYYILFNLINGRVRKASSNERNAFGKLFSNVQEKINGISETKIYKKENFIFGLFERDMKRYLKCIKKIVLFNALGMGISGLFTSVLPILVLIYGVFLTYNNVITIGTLIAFYTYLSFLNEPINNLSDFNLGLQRSLGMSNRVLGFLELEGDNQENKLTIDLFNKIDVKNVTFGYKKDKLVLKDINFSINCGEKIAIIGESGSGKTSLMNLIMGFYQPIKGEVLINKENVYKYNEESLFLKISLLQQNPIIFSGTIKDNILFGENYLQPRLDAVIKYTKLGSLVERFEKGLEEEITEQGSNLSGGEKQRISIARAIIREPELLILDEPTSALDVKTETSIVEHLDCYINEKKITMIAITHKPTILSMCDKVYHIFDKQLKIYNMQDKIDRTVVMNIVDSLKENEENIS